MKDTIRLWKDTTRDMVMAVCVGLHNSLCQRLARLTRQTLAFSKKLANHIGAIWFFVHRYNAALSA